MIANDSRLQQFRRDLRYAASISKVGGGKYGYLKSQNYIGITSITAARKAYKAILRMARAGFRISADLEEGNVDIHGQPTKDNSGIAVPLVYGFCGKIGTSYVYPLQHPDAPVTERVRRYCRKIVRKLLKHPEIRFVFQHGSYDIEGSKRLLNATVKNYDFDTNYAEFFSYPERHSFALDAIAAARFPEFADYKEIVAPDSFTTQTRKYFIDNSLKKAGIHRKYTLARKKLKNGMNLALLPWEKMVLYNGADNDIQKRIEVSTKKKVSLPLLHVYQDAQFVIERMEKNPPIFDYRQYDKLVKHYPVLREWLYKKLVEMSGKKDLNPNSPQQISHIIYKVLKLPQLTETPSTGKDTLAALTSYHKFPALLSEYRRVEKIRTTYLAGFVASADQNHGKLRTIWWLTGTRTGRLSSGGGDTGESGVVNLQNIHGDPFLQCLIVSDPRWRKLYEFWAANTTCWLEVLRDKKGKIVRDAHKKPVMVWKYEGGFTEETWQQFGEMDVFLGFDHSQMELRCVAQKSGDKNLIAAFKRGDDIHAVVGHELTGWSIEQVKNDEGFRRLVKNMHFGIVFGLNEDNLAPYMRAKGVEDVDDEEVKKFYRLYFKRYSGVADMIEDCRQFAEEHGYVETMFGFRRRLNVGMSEKGAAFWGNQAINTPIQGTAHQIMLMGIIPVHRQPVKYALLQRPVLEIHDAIYFLTKLKEMFAALKLGKDMLEKDAIDIVKNDFDIDWKVPLKAEPKAALRFGVQVKDVGVEGKGAENEWEFLNKWCQKNRELELKFKKEHKETLERIAV